MSITNWSRTHLFRVGRRILFVSIQGPCEDNVIFWESLLAQDFMRRRNVILDGDLNFAISKDLWK